MSDPVHIKPAEFFEFIDRPGIVVLFLSVHPAHVFNRALAKRFTDLSGDEIVCGIAKLLDLVVSESPALPFLHNGLVACGVPSAFNVMPGYYLFRQGQVVAYESGLPIFEDAKGIVRGTLLGAVLSALTQNITLAGMAFRFATEEVTAQRIAYRFRQAASRPQYKHQAYRPTTADELREAYRILGVSPACSDQEVHRAWRELRVKFHPDFVPNDSEEFERRSRLSAEINRAFEIIQSHRQRSRRSRTR